MNDQELEDMIEERGLTAPRITPDHIEAVIVDEQYVIAPGTTTTIAILTLWNGFTVLGESACADPANFDEEIGRRIARDNAKNKIWALEGYLLKQRLTVGQVEDVADPVIARICHEVNKAWCEYQGDNTQVSWDHAPDWQKISAINGVRFHRSNPDAGDDASHNNWMAEKIENGWTYGPEKSTASKKHPCIMPFEDLPPEQQFKDRLFRTVVHAALAHMGMTLDWFTPRPHQDIVNDQIVE